MPKLTDRLLLLVTGLVGAAFAFIFFRVTREVGMIILSISYHAVLFSENYRLNRRVKQLEQQLDTYRGHQA